MVNWTEVSKRMAHFLRHHPSGMDISEEGFVPLDELLSRLRERWPDLVEDDIRKLVEKDRKGRYEIQEGEIRACYGHSDAVQALLEAKAGLKGLREREEELEELKKRYEELKDDRDKLLAKSKREDLENLKESLWAINGYLERLERDNKEGKISDKEYQAKRKHLLKEKWDAQHKMLILKDWLEEAVEKTEMIEKAGEELVKGKKLKEKEPEEELTPLMKEYEEETGKHAKWGGELTKGYKEWRKKQKE